ncbi:MAG: fructoselysine 6-kinase [Clostridia bacterium]|nr:fructoselysine 6-kinase [Clostridia bacterium]
MKLATVGDNCIDFYAEQNKIFPGGNPVNVAVYAKRIQLEASYTGAVGNDKNGQFMIHALKGKGVDTSHTYILKGKTAVTQVDLVDGERVFGEYDEGVLPDYVISDEDIRFFLTHDLLHTGLWGHAERALHKIKSKGLPLSFDFAKAKEGEVFDVALPSVDYAFFSDENESEQLLHFIKSVYERGPKIVVVTLGGNGSIAYDGNRFLRCGVVPTKVVDTMGAGDSYIAGFCKGLISKKPIDKCMEMGSICAAETLQYMGAW